MILLRRLHIHAFKQLMDIHIEFPRRGSILVEGANESGKSTLFEAIYFALYGRPLVGEEERPSLDDVIPHDATAAQVTLHVLTGDSELEIRRTVARGRAGKSATQKVSLRVSRPGAPVEEIATTRAADDRIEQELHGLNGDTLRNSCFMEQKALDRIESLDRERREASVARLLGIGEIQKIEKDLERTLQARKEQRTRCQAELEVAAVRRDSAAAERAQAIALERLSAARVRALLDARDRHEGDTADSGRAEANLRAEREALVTRLDDAARMRALRDDVAAASVTIGSARQASRVEADTRARLDDLDRLERDELPLLRDRLAALTAASAALAAHDAAQVRLAALERALVALDNATQARDAEADAERALEAAQTEAARLTASETLARWARLKETQQLIREGDEKQDALGRQRQARAALHTATRQRVRQSLRACLLLLLLSLTSGVAGIAFHLAWIPASILLATTAVLALRLRAALRDASAATAALAHSERAESEARAKRETAQRLAGSLDELPRLESELLLAGVPIPDSPATALSMSSNEPGAAYAADAARRAVEEARLMRARRYAAREAAEAEARAARAHSDQLRLVPLASSTALSPPTPIDANTLSSDATSPDTLHDAVADARADADIAGAELQRHLDTLQLPRDAAAIAAARGAAKQDSSRLVVQLAGRDALTHEHMASLTASGTALRSAHTQLAALGSRAHDAGIASVPPLTHAMTPEELDTSREWLAAALETRLAALDEPGARVALGRTDERLHALTRDGDAAALSRGEQVAQIRDLLAEWGITADGTEPLAALAPRWSALAEVDAPDLDALQRTLQDVRAEAHHQRERAAELAQRHNLDGDELDAEECRVRLDTIERDLRRHALAVEMAQTIRARIVRRVIPETAVYMRSLLPELTAGRYRDVRLQSTDGSEADLRVRVWDQLAGRYVAKNLFSGGTRDQCSLALRLAFALATLPQELGAMPGFIFLDEPLSSFDAERSRALIHVITRGTIAQQFAQVVLISHSQSFERDSLHYHVRMMGGRIASTNLPTEREAAALWDTESAIASSLIPRRATT
ncbi:MAG TPA: AAA family ATPase [Ktedonobacterales bacterium]|nr:AAA family ATPase [Ktedonobacterales bacterium]